MPRGRPSKKVKEAKENAEESKENVSRNETEDPPAKKIKKGSSAVVTKITIEHCTS